MLTTAHIISGLKIFIFTSFIVNFYHDYMVGHHNVEAGRNFKSFFLQAEAGSKSSKASSKTTVIAIDGGGGGGKAHPMPVPWPVVHCHHHHHHLKYVPKPILIHHWVKKYKPEYEFASSDEHSIIPSFEIEKEKKKQHYSIESSELQPSMLNTNSKLPHELMAGSKLISTLNSPVFGDQGLLQTASLPITDADLISPQLGSHLMQPQSQPQQAPLAAPISTLPTITREQVERELKKMQLKNGNKPLQPKQLNTLARQLLLQSAATTSSSNKRQLQPTVGPKYTIDSVDSLKDITVTNAGGDSEPSDKLLDSTDNVQTKNKNKQPANANHSDRKESTKLIKNLHKSSDNGSFFSTTRDSETRFHRNIKPNHLFDEPHDQLNDESHQIRVREKQLVENSINNEHKKQYNSKEDKFVSDLQEANRREQVAAKQQFENLSSEQANRLLLLRASQQVPSMNDAQFPLNQHKQFQTNKLAASQPVEVQKTLSHPNLADIKARMTGSSSRERHTIDLMTSLAEQMAEKEAKNLINKQRKLQQLKNRSQQQQQAGNKTAVNGTNLTENIERKGILRSVGSIAASLFGSQSKNQRDKRRQLNANPLLFSIQNPSSLTPHILPSLSNNRILPFATRTTTMRREIKPQHGLFTTYDPSNKNSERSASVPIDRMMIQASNLVTKVENPLAINDITRSSKNSVKADQDKVDSINIYRETPEKNATAAQKSGSKDAQNIRGSTEIAKISEPDSSTVALTTMSPDQESRFYHGQMEHLFKIANHHNRNGYQMLNGIRNTAPKVYNSLPSNVHNSIVSPSEPLQASNQSIELSNNTGNEIDESQREVIMSPETGNQPFKDYQPWEQQLLQLRLQHQLEQQQQSPSYNTETSGFPPAVSSQVNQVYNPTVQLDSFLNSTYSTQTLPSSELMQSADQQQQQQQQQDSMNQQYQNMATTFPSYLEFPISPENWSAETLRSINSIDVLPSSDNPGNNGGEIDSEQSKQKDEVNDSNFQPNQIISSPPDAVQDQFQYEQLMMANDGRYSQLQPAQQQAQSYKNLGHFSDASHQIYQTNQMIPYPAQQHQSHSMFASPTVEQIFNGYKYNGGPESGLGEPPNSSSSGYSSASFFHQQPHLKQTSSLMTPYASFESNFKPSFVSPSSHSPPLQQQFMFSGGILPISPMLAAPSNLIGSSSGVFTPIMSELNLEPMQVMPASKFLTNNNPKIGKKPISSSSKSFKKGNDLSSINSLTSFDNLLPSKQQGETLSTATNQMNQLRQFHNSISQNTNQGGNNITQMARLSQQLRDQMRTLQGRLPQMPNIPNIPQPPQLPNLPMPPPGMMQMAGLALPFAMARANRIRNQQVNAAANGGGTSTGQRLLNTATRLIRPRRRPTSSPSGRPNVNVDKNRRRFSNIIQTVVDMRRRPVAVSSATSHRYSAPVSASAASALTGASSKFKPKIDRESNRLSRSINWFNRTPHYHNQQIARSNLSSSNKPGIVMPGLPIATLNDGSLVKFGSMTSPVDILAQQMSQYKQRQRRSKVATPIKQQYITSDRIAMAQQQDDYSPSKRLPPQIAIPSPYSYQLISRNSQTNENATNLHPAFQALPLVANHINLLMFTAQNVTSDLAKHWSRLKEADQKQQQKQQQQQQQVETQHVETANLQLDAQNLPDSNAVFSTQADRETLRQLQPQQEQEQVEDPSQIQTDSGRFAQQQVEEEQQQQMIREQQQQQIEAQENSGLSSEQEKRQVGVINRGSTSKGTLLQPVYIEQEKVTNRAKGTMYSHKSRISGKENVDEQYRQDSSTFIPTLVRVNRDKFKPLQQTTQAQPIQQSSTTLPALSMSIQAPPQTSTATSKAAATTTTTSTTSTTSTTTSTTSTTAKPSSARDEKKQVETNKKHVKVSEKSKRSTRRPKGVGEALSVREASSGQRSAIIEGPTTTTTTTTLRPKPTTTTTTASSETDGNSSRETRITTNAPLLQEQRQQQQQSEPIPLSSNENYVRAIKLVRGVSYPWPPPTKSSKLFEGPVELDTTIDSADARETV